jgi:hypothetical protein
MENTMTTKADITLLPCPCCGATAKFSLDYENGDGEPAVECSECNLLAWTPEDWNRRAAVEADRQGRMPSDESAQGAGRVLPEDVPATLVQDLRSAVEGECDGLDITETQARMILGFLLSRNRSGQPAAQYECDTCQDSGIVGHSDICPDCRGEGRIAHLGAGVAHTDDDAVDHFAAAMKDKLAQARAKGRYGWREIDPSDLSMMLRSHVDKGDPRDVANFCMFLWSLGKPISAAPDPVAQEPVYQVQYNNEGWRDASASRYEAVGKAMAYSDASRWERRIVYAAPVAAQPPVVAWMDDGSTTRGPGKPEYRVVSAATKAEMPALVAAAYSTPLGVIGAAQPCDHIYEARPIDGSRRASVPVEAVCRKCGARGGVSLTPDMQRDEKRGAESGRDQENAAALRAILMESPEAVSYPNESWTDAYAEWRTVAIDAARAAKGAGHG